MMIVKTECESCHQLKAVTRTALVAGKYYRNICDNCLGAGNDELSSNAAGYSRRRTYEDNAHETIQPYDANGQPRVEFLRLYPAAAAKVFSKDEIAKLKRKI